MIAGIVLFALGLKETIEQVGEPLATIPAVALCGGLSLCFLAHVAMRVRLVYLVRRVTTERPGWIGPGRLATAIGMLAVIPAALAPPALAALALVAALCWALIAWGLKCPVLAWSASPSPVGTIRSWRLRRTGSP